MKILFLAILVFSFLYSEEMQRIEDIVNDISKLRVDYEECSKQLQVQNGSGDLIDTLKHQLQDEKQKNSILNKEQNKYTQSSKNSDALVLKIEEFEKIVNNQEKA